MCIPIVFQRIQQIFNMDTGLGFTFYGETAFEKKSIGILPARGKLPQIHHIAADCHIRPAMQRGMQTTCPNPEIDVGACIPDPDADGFAIDLGEAVHQSLPPQQVVKAPGKNNSMDIVRDDAQ